MTKRYRTSCLSSRSHASLIFWIGISSMSDTIPLRGAEVQHLLRLGDSADARAGEVAARQDQIEGGHRQRLFGRADQRERAVQFQQAQVGIDVVLGGNRIEDEVEAALLLASSRRHPWTRPPRARPAAGHRRPCRARS